MIQDGATGAAAPTYGFLRVLLTAKPETKVVLVICAVFSLISWFIIATKWWEFRRLSRRRRDFTEAMSRAQGTDAREHAVASLGVSPFAEIIRVAMTYLSDLRATMQKQGVERAGLSLTQLEALTLTLETEVGREVENVGRMVPMLATIGATAPLLGLLGTVLGIMNSFLGIAQKGTGNISAVAPGIADALIATAAGLAAAIPAVVAYNIYTSKAQRFEGELERLAQETIGALGREGRL